MNIREIINSLAPKKVLAPFRVGDTVRVHVKIREGEKERIQIFEGFVIKKRRGLKTGSFTVRKISYGIGVERIFPLESQALEKVEIVQRGKVRRARLFYLRSKKGKSNQIQDGGPIQNGSEADSFASEISDPSKFQTQGVQEEVSPTL